MKKDWAWNQRERFSIRKYSFGAASVVIGVSLMMGGYALADEQALSTPQQQDLALQTHVANNSDVTAANDTVTAIAPDGIIAGDVSIVAQPPAQAPAAVETIESEEPINVVAGNDAIPERGQASEEFTKVDVGTQTDEIPAKQAEIPAVSPVAARQAPETKAAAITRADASTTVVTGGKDIPSQGYYSYPERTEVRNSPDPSAPLVFYANAGDRVFYDQVLNQNGYQWISYRSYSGIRRYANIAKLVSQAAPQADAKVTGNIKVENITAQGFDVIISDASDSNGLAKVKVPTWTEKNDQDDLIWYDATKQADGRYKLTVKTSNHKGEAGTYQVHVYYQETDGQVVPVGAVQATVPAPNVSDNSEITLPALERYTFDREVEVKNELKASAATAFTFKKGESINYDKRIKADGYNWISYISYSGVRRYVMLDQLAVPSNPQKSDSKATGQISFENQTAQGFDIRISNVSDNNGVLAVKVPVWTVKNDQDDLIWYDGVKQGDGTYKVAVKLADHKNETGDYAVHLYYVENDGKMIGVAGVQHTVEAGTEPQITRTGTLSFSNQANGDFDIIVSNVSDSKGLKAVKVPVWTDKNDQDDLIWYDGIKQGDGTYKVTVKRSDHKNETGLYQVHLYYVEDDGQMVGIAGAQNRVAASNSGRAALPNQGTYTFAKRTEVRNQADLSSPIQFYFNQGESVHYDKTLEADGQQWISYMSYSGIRRYINIAPQ
ncbi:GBS Bsp-like repeat-containing protein [Streptococcus dentasini]